MKWLCVFREEKEWIEIKKKNARAGNERFREKSGSEDRVSTKEYK